MTNYIYNYLEIELQEEDLDIFNSNDFLLDEYIPMPDHYEHQSPLSRVKWCQDNWGTSDDIINVKTKIKENKFIAKFFSVESHPSIWLTTMAGRHKNLIMEIYWVDQNRKHCGHHKLVNGNSVEVFYCLKKDYDNFIENIFPKKLIPNLSMIW